MRLGVALAFLLAVPAAALADAPPRFAFTSTSPVNVAAGGTTAVRVCNGTGAPLDVSFTLESLRGFDLDPATVTGIAPGECGETAVVAPAAITGSPAGTIVATSRVGVIRRAVVPTDVGAARSAATDLTLAAEHYLGSQHAHLVGAASLSLGPYPEATKAADVEAPSGVLAVLQNGSHRAYLTVPKNAGVTLSRSQGRISRLRAYAIT